MNDKEQGQRTAAAEAAGQHGSRAAAIEAGLMRYLAAEAYREKVEEGREDEHAEADETH